MNLRLSSAVDVILVNQTEGSCVFILISMEPCFVVMISYGVHVHASNSGPLDCRCLAACFV